MYNRWFLRIEPLVKRGQRCCIIDDCRFPSREPDAIAAVNLCGQQTKVMSVPRFYFDLSNGHRVPDHAGLDCDNEKDAKQKADFIARDIARQAEAIPKKHLTVVDERGEDIYQAPIKRPS
jgi:hypothetical protein